MKALGVTLALGCAVVLIPATARAERIGEKEASTVCALDMRSSPERDRGDAIVASDDLESEGEHVGPLGNVVALDLDEDGDIDHTIERRQGLEHSAEFASHGTVAAFSDDRHGTGEDHDFDGFGSDLKKQTTLALRIHDDNKPVDGSKVFLPRADAAASPNPEPASMFLIGTGLAGLFRYRRQLFA